MRTIHLVALSCLAFAAACSAPANSSSRLIAKVKEFRELRDAGRIDEAKRMLAPDPREWFQTREGPGDPWKLEGGRWAHWDEFMHGRVDCEDWTTDAHSVTVLAWELNDFYRALERGRQPLHLTWFFDDDLRITGLFVSDVGLEHDRGRSAEFKAWAKANRAAELDYLEPGGAIDPTGDRPERYLALLNAWRASVGLAPIG